MEVQVAEGSGFCFGVKRAVTMAKAAAGSGRIYSLGPLIHNPREIARLSACVCVVDSLEDIDFANTGVLPRVVVRSHGVGPEVYAQAAALGLDLVDATCPFVQKAQRAAEELYQAGRQVIIVGDHNHPEVLGINAWSKFSLDCCRRGGGCGFAGIAGGQKRLGRCGADHPDRGQCGRGFGSYSAKSRISGSLFS